MSRINLGVNQFARKTFEGAPSKVITPLQELRRSVLASLMWEDEFYESGKAHAARVAHLVSVCSGLEVSKLAIQARNDMHLRHIPLFLVREMARHKSHRPYVKNTLANVIQRPDELAEFLAIYWKGQKDADKESLAASVKKGLAEAFTKFTIYQLAKYNRDNPIKLRDVMFLVHPKPTHSEQANIWKQLAENTLPTPDTWETELSAGKDKKATWTRLISERKLGGFALIRNLRNMIAAGVDDDIVSNALLTMKADNILPFRFLAALPYAPRFAPQLEAAMLRCLEGKYKFPGKTIVLVDVSGSMHSQISAKSDLRRQDAAAGLAILARELCDNVRVMTFSDNLVEVAAYRGLALKDAIDKSQLHRNTYLGRAVTEINKQKYDRLIVLTDEQSADAVPNPIGNKGYMINVASYANGVGYGAWTNISGWSERVLDYIQLLENEVES